MRYPHLLLPGSVSWEAYCSFIFVYNAVFLFQTKILVSVEHLRHEKAVLWGC